MIYFCYQMLTATQQQLSLWRFKGPFSRWTSVSCYKKFPFLIILELRLMEVVVTTGAVKTCRAPVKKSPLTNQHQVFYRPDALPVANPTVSEHWRAGTQAFVLFCSKMESFIAVLHMDVLVVFSVSLSLRYISMSPTLKPLTYSAVCWWTVV